MQTPTHKHAHTRGARALQLFSAQVAEAGVDMFVAGSAIFKNPRTVEAYTETIDGMRAELAAAKATLAAK